MKKTNKTFKRFAAITSASLLAACAMAPVFTLAAEGDPVTPPTYSISINNSTVGHTYEAYQIFTGDLVDGVLSNIKWGTGITEEGKTYFGDASEKAETLVSEDDVKAFAKEVAQYLSDEKISDDYTDSSYSLTVPTAGYYLVKDADNSLADDANDSYTRYIVEVLGTKTGINPKASIPSVIKKVKENEKDVTSTGQAFAGEENYNVGEQYNDVADYSIGDSVPFKLYGTLPSTLVDYDSYYYCFTDTLASSLTAPLEGDVKVYIDDVEVEQGGNLRVTVSGQNISIAFEDVKAAGAVAGSIVTVEYDAVLNSDAVIGLPGQENKVDLTYSNNPNEIYAPTLNDEEIDTPDDTGKTPEDKVIVFTYKIEATKVDGTDNTITLPGAEFKLLNSDKTKAASVVDGKFVEWVDVTNGTTLTTPSTGIISIAGLDDGTYYLRETKAPDKYNLLEEDFEIEIDATTVNNQVWSGNATDALTGALADDGTVSGLIENNKGTTLPGTGGIGTTIFYLGGGAMAAIGGIYLISKRRMKKSEE